MISQKCPKCSSPRVKHGYSRTTFWSKLICRYNLHCESCNWEFRGFAVPGTVTSKPSKKRKTISRSVTKKPSKKRNEAKI